MLRLVSVLWRQAESSPAWFATLCPPGFHGQLNLTPCPTHGASLIVILSSLLISLTLVASFAGFLSQVHSILRLAVLGGVLLISSLLPILVACPHLPDA